MRGSPTMTTAQIFAMRKGVQKRGLLAELNRPIAPARAPRGEGAKSRKKQVSLLESRFANLWVSLGGPTLEREVKLLENRRCRWDFVHRASRLAVEINGGIWIKSGHSTGKGIRRDAEKNKLATLAGWCCVVLTAQDVTADEVARLIEWTRKETGE